MRCVPWQRQNNLWFLSEKLPLVDPNLLDDIFDTFIRSKYFYIAISTEDAELYTQITLENGDEDFHRNLWRPNDTQPMDINRMMRCTYIITISPYRSIESSTLCVYDDSVPLPVTPAV